MKKIFIILFICAFNKCYPQSIVKFVSSKTRKPISGIYAQIILNYDTFLNNGISDKKGYLRIKIPDSDLNSNYHLRVNMLRFKYIFKELYLKNKDTLVVKLKENKYLLKNSENYFSSKCHKPSFFKYEPKTIRSFKDLPDSISKKVKLYIKKRVGKRVFKSFELIDGLMMDLDKLKDRNPKSEYKTTYFLCFSYRNLNAGISIYASTIELDKNGNILKDIDFPILNSNSFKDLIPFSEIKKKAAEKGFYNKNTRIDIGFIVKENLLVWKFINEKTINDHQISKEEVLFDIQDGEYIKINKILLEYVN